MGVTVTNLLQGPAELRVSPFGTVEPTFTVDPLNPAWRDPGGTDGGARLVIAQNYSDMEVDQVPMAVGTRLVKQVLTVTTSLAEATLTNLKMVLNQAITGGEVQTISLGSATAGSITITFNGQTTSSLPFNSTAAAVQTALQALSTIGSGNVTVTGGPLPALITLTFGGVFTGVDVPQVTVTPTGLTGGTVAVATTTQGDGGSFELVSAITNADPLYKSVMLIGQKPGGGPRLIIVRRCLITDNIEMAWKKDDKTMIPCQFSGYYVSSSINPLRIEDKAS